jgi:bacterial/archaeal transporter family-2 protein
VAALVLRERSPAVAALADLGEGTGPGVPLSLALTFAVGAGISLQAFLNGRLSGSLGSVELAAAANNVIGLTVTVALGLATGALARALRRLRAAGARPRWWHLLGGVCSASLVYITTRAAPEVGVALLTVALVCGQTGGSLAVDAAAMSPAGHHRLSAARILGVVLAVVAVGIGALGSHGDLDLDLLALVLVAGTMAALQQAANGHLATLTGEPFAAALANFVLSVALLVAVALVVTGGGAPGGWDAPAPEWMGGLLGVAVVVVTAWVVPVLGVLRLMLALVAGQTAGALVIDLIAPAPGEPVTVGTVGGVVLTLVAVFVSGRGRRPAGARPPLDPV